MSSSEIERRPSVYEEKPRKFTYFHLTLVLLSVLTLFRFWYCTTLGLTGDEAYYWVCSRHLALSYFDKGPGVAATIALGTHLFGDTAFGVRFFAVICSFATGLSIFVLGQMLFSARVGWFAVVIATVVPMFAAGSILMTIDPLSVFFWTAAAIAFWRAKDSQSFVLWIASGALVGMGGLAKYTNLAELLCFALFCLCCKEYRRQFCKPRFYAMLAASLVCSLPVLIWNSRHGWITVEHLLHRGALDGAWQFSLCNLGLFIAGQAGVISPLLFLCILGALVGPRLAPSFRVTNRFLLCLFLPLFLFYIMLSINRAGQANWTAPAYIAGIIIFAAKWTFGQSKHRWLRSLGIAAVLIGIIETLLLHNTYLLHLPPGRDPLNRTRGSDFIAMETSKISAREGTRFDIADKYMLASLLSFYLPQHPTVFLPYTAKISNQYSIWPGYREQPLGSSALFLSDRKRIPKILLSDFEEIKFLEVVSPTYQGQQLKQHYIYLCRGLRTSALHI